MKHIFTMQFYACKSILLIVILVILNNTAMAQVPQDTVKPKVDATTITAYMDTTKPAQTAPATTPATGTNENAARKHKQFPIYTQGVNSNTMSELPRSVTMQIQVLATR